MVQQEALCTHWHSGSGRVNGQTCLHMLLIGMTFMLCTECLGMSAPAVVARNFAGSESVVAEPGFP